jgi:hypothetical protein
MIPESWLIEKLETTELQIVWKNELARVGLSEPDLQELMSEGPSPRFREKWQAFVGRMVAGDELWRFESPPRTWNEFAGRSGYARVRAGRILDSIVTSKS